MKTPILLAIILCLSFVSQRNYAQSKYGNATMDELKMTVYPLDTTASAVILLKKGDIRFVYNDLYGFQFEYSIQVKMKILKTEGLDWCNQQIVYKEQSRTAKEQINGLSGTTYNLENGEVVKTKLSKEFITDEDIDNKIKVKKFTMPATKVGSVVEYKYTLVSDFYYDLRDFSFQESIPVAYTYFEAKLPEYFNYNFNFQGYVKLKTEREPANEMFNIRYKDSNGRLQSENIRCTAELIKSEGRDIPALKKEAYLWTVNDFISKISFELKSVQMPYSMTQNMSNSWENIDNDILSSSFGSNMKKADLFKEEIAKGETTIERAKEIQNMVKYRVKWNDRRAASPGNLKDALKNGMGSSADVNFLLVNALQAGGFDAFPVILSTRGNGRLPISHPSITAFNYTITGVRIDTMMYFTDASAKYGDWNLLPEKCMVQRARIIKQNGCRWVDLSTISGGSVLKAGKFSFENSKYTGKVTDNRRGSAALDMKEIYYGHKDKDDFITTLARQTNCEIDSFSISGTDDTNAPLKIEYTQTSDMSLGDDFLYINPMLNKHIAENPFKEEKRVYPVEFDYLINYLQISDITIPEGYAVDELPQAAKLVLNDNDIILTYRFAQNGNQIKLHYQFQLKKLIFLPDEYEHLRDFYAKIVAKNSEQIVLKKISEI
ncbi:DUF3857 domain-containing protein [Dysgonomonas sp. 521]|uniref:DUF3857 domain-containing protein n=1 Tax=Dysgonomonas sp. 521 TaxID=2302932 RepID=UPI0013D64058|nr:DUF3857 domain-containing protein [Dysgonomonas sp. 521]NDV94096.1 DUF3857 domain-containing protein [Dysgonomonas sp. 521]